MATPAGLVPASPAADLTRLASQTQDFLRKAQARSTRVAYESDWTHFDSWCRRHGLASLPATPQTVALYITDLAASRKPATLRRRLTVISRAHIGAGHPSPASLQQPLVGDTLKGICRDQGTAQDAKQPLFTDHIREIIGKLPDNLQGRRDRALLLVGFAGGFRRSELASLTSADITCGKDGMVILLRRSKTDQEGQGRRVALPYGSHPDTCPVRAFEEWVKAAKITAGPVFRNIDRHGRLAPRALCGASIGLIVKRLGGRIGLDPRLYGGHSLRAGLVTQAYVNGASFHSIMQQTGHRSIVTVRKYIRDATLFRDNSAAKLGL